MKNTPSRTAARGSILVQNFFIVFSLLCLTIVLKYAGLAIPGWFILAFTFVIQPILIVVLTIYRFRKGHDGIVLKKWQTEKSEATLAKKSRINVLKTVIRNEDYPIRSIVPEEGKMGVFRISFSVDILEVAMPIIILDGTRLGVEKDGDDSVICHAGKAIHADKAKLTFRSGKFAFTIANPYYLADSIPSDEIHWQCEGHAPEKNIFINGDYFPHKDPRVAYPFNLMVNGLTIGTYTGSYVPEVKAIVIKIASVNKSQCVNRECVLKPVFDPRKKISLPKPTVISVDGELKRQLSFA